MPFPTSGDLPDPGIQPTSPALAAAAAAKLHQSYPTLCDPIDCSPPGSPIHGILQPRVLEWVAIAFSPALAGGFFTASTTSQEKGAPHSLLTPNSTVLNPGFTNLWLPRGEGGGIVTKFGKVMYTLLYSKWITNKDLLYSTWNSAHCYVPAWMGGGVGGRTDTCMYVWLSPFTVHLKLSQHCYTTIQNKKFKVKEKITGVLSWITWQVLPELIIKGSIRSGAN